jgi:hypothetical protein
MDADTLSSTDRHANVYLYPNPNSHAAPYSHPDTHSAAFAKTDRWASHRRLTSCNYA